ncbi:TetR/AcrR family transcriptional regulator [Nocardia sp. XZ_19_231]|uniref:TetR/AcrR family transcriptional regulator n=1 Tax=Nocardia sp. XZ_19_231 TaxID=2769252 RepID=UPI00188F6EFC|nr:TetR/AcrR family transcriptional regulator [Nocardia sp. XZ_19_231]
MSSTRTTRRKSARYYTRREQVIDVAVELFSKNGYASTGVADIGTAAGLARGALYYYIGSKEELLAEIHDRVMDPLLTESSAIVGLDVCFEARLQLLSESLLRQILGRRNHVWVFLHEHRQLQGEYRARFRVKRQRFESCIRDVLAEGAGLGKLRVQDLELATLAFLNLHNYTYQWVARRDDLEVEELARFYCQVFLNGILSEQLDQDAIGPQLAHGRSVLGVLAAKGLDH